MFQKIAVMVFVVLLVLSGLIYVSQPSGFSPEGPNQVVPYMDDHLRIYLPVVKSAPTPVYSINIPEFTSETFSMAETAILWFGRVTPSENYADVRIGYTESELRVYLVAFDRRLWYKQNPSAAVLKDWDSASLYISLDGRVGAVPSQNTYRFDGQLNWWEARDGYQYAYQGDGSGWKLAPVPFTTRSGWAGFPQPNDNLDDRGWSILYSIPFTSLGLSEAPAAGATWGLAFQLNDRDDELGFPNPVKTWPEKMFDQQPSSWGQMVFGLPEYMPPVGVHTAGATTIRHKLNGSVVVDGMVGGSSICGEGMDYWTTWGQRNYAGAEQVNVQNEVDISDWPCFSKFYITFPLSSIPPGKVILSASLVLHSVGNAGGGDWGEPSNALIQVFTVDQDWNEDTLAWNNAPLALENVSRAWVPPIDAWPGWPGVPREWDLSYAVSKSYAEGGVLRIALYSADTAYNTGRYFSTSDYADWNEAGRPTLIVEWGEPQQ